MTFEVKGGAAHLILQGQPPTLSISFKDNSPVKYALNASELMGDLSNKITNDIHLLYPIDHPHLSHFRVTIENNSGIVHNAPPLPNGTFSGDFFFRGEESGPAGGPVIVAGDPVCAYAVKLIWKTRHYHSNRGDSRHTQILYCKLKVIVEKVVLQGWARLRMPSLSH